MKKTVLLTIIMLIVLMTGCENMIIPQHQKSLRSSDEAVLYLGQLMCKVRDGKKLINCDMPIHLSFCGVLFLL